MPGTKICGFKDLILVFLIGFGLAGCSDSGTGGMAEILIQVGKSVVTEDEFNQAFDMAGYGNADWAEPGSHQFEAARLHMLNQLTEELLLLERARELNITVSDPELETEILNTKKAYPDNTFDNTLLENAIFFKAWRERLRRHMLMKKIIAKELEEQVLITPEDVRAYYNNYLIDGNEWAKPEKVFGGIDLATVLKLRRDRAIQAYQPWIKELYKKYQIKINHSLWDKMTDLPTVDTEVETVSE